MTKRTSEVSTADKKTLEEFRLVLNLVRVPEISFSTAYITPPNVKWESEVRTAVVVDKDAWKTVYVFMDVEIAPKTESEPVTEAFKLRYRIAGIWESDESLQEIDEPQLINYMAKRANLELYPLLHDRVHLFLASLGIKVNESAWSAPNNSLIDIQFLDHKK